MAATLESNTVVQETVKTINVKSYGAVGDGTNDDTKSIQNAIDYASANKCNLYMPAGTYLVNSLRIKNGLKKFVCDGTLKGMGKSGVGILTIDGPYIFKGTAVNGCYIKANIDMSNGDIFAIHADGCTNCIFDGNHIFGFTNSNVEKYGILLERNSNHNKITNNDIEGVERSAASQVAIGLFGGSERYGGFFNNGNVTLPTEPCIDNLVENNKVSYCSYAVDLLACQGCIVKNNYCFKQHHRAIYLANSANHCLISKNSCLGYGSSAILLGYGSNNNIVVNNICKQIAGYNSPGAEAAININTGAYENKAIKNVIESFTNYGVYMAVNSIGNVADGNKISGYYLSGIAIENEWESPHPVSAKYSRPNYAPPLMGNKWASKDSEGNVIQNNIIGDPYPGRDGSAIYVSQVGTTTQTKNNIIQNNVINLTNPNSKPIYFYQNTKDQLNQNTEKNNRTKGGKKMKAFIFKEN